MAARDQLERGAAERQRIDAGMGVKAPVFIGEQQFQVTGIDSRLRVNRQPPAAIGHRVGAQQLAVAVDDGGGNLPRLLQRQRTERDEPSGERKNEREDTSERNSGDANRSSPTNSVMPGLVPGSHVYSSLRRGRGWPGQARP